MRAVSSALFRPLTSANAAGFAPGSGSGLGSAVVVKILTLAGAGGRAAPPRQGPGRDRVGCAHPQLAALMRARRPQSVEAKARCKALPSCPHHLRAHPARAAARRACGARREGWRAR